MKTEKPKRNMESINCVDGELTRSTQSKVKNIQPLNGIDTKSCHIERAGRRTKYLKQMLNVTQMLEILLRQSANQNDIVQLVGMINAK